MGKNTSIEWCMHTFNHVRGCTKVSEGCRNCYAERNSKRNPKVLGEWGPTGRRVIASESYWMQLLKWDAAAKTAGERHRVFCASLADVFEGPETMPAESRDAVWEARARLFRLIDRTSHLDWLLLTKRPENIAAMWPSRTYVDDAGHQFGLCKPTGVPFRRDNVWLGASVENQEAASRVHDLLLCRALSPVLFLSCEPLVGPLDLTAVGYRDGKGLCNALTGQSTLKAVGYDGTLFGVVTDEPKLPRIDWVICGGESGPKARPMDPAWARALRDQCASACVPFFFKQWGEYEEATIMVGDAVRKVGKKNAGRTLDGRTWDETPEVRL